jgi:hypothetical protein
MIDNVLNGEQGLSVRNKINSVIDKVNEGVSKSDIGLGSVDNTSDVDKPISTATQAALNLKANLASPALTGTPTAPTAAVGTNTTQLATTAFVEAATAPATLLADIKTVDGVGSGLDADLLDGLHLSQIKTNFISPSVKPVLDLDFASQEYSEYVAPNGKTNKALTDALTVTRSTTATYVDPTGKIRTAEINAPRINYRDGVGALLVEEARTNLLTYSEQFDNAAWVKTRASITANTIVAPDGTLTADKLVEDAAASTTHYCQQTIAVTAGTAYTASCFFKASERASAAIRFASGGLTWGAGGAEPTFIVDLVNGAVTNIGGVGVCFVLPVGGGWYRALVTATAQVSESVPLRMMLSSSGSIPYTGDGVSGIFIWGAQLEVGSTPSSYIPTTTAQVTRAADNIVRDLTTLDGWNPSEGSIYFEGLLNSNTVGETLFQIGSSTNNGVRILRMTSTVLRAEVRNSSGTISVNSNVSYTTGSVLKCVINYGKDVFLGVFNGSVLSEVVPESPLIQSSSLSVGSRTGNTNKVGWAENKIIRYYPRALSESDCIALTAL